MCRFLVVTSILFCLTITGCEAELYRAETRLLPDGTIERAISQPQAQVPQAARQKSAGWDDIFTTQPARKAVDKELPIRDLPRSLGPNPRSQGATVQQPVNFVAWGKFANYAAIPDHFEFAPIADGKKGQLIRKLERHDLGFLTEWVWTETLADTVDLTDHRIARTELAREAISLAIAAGKEAWGPDYDLEKLEQWLRNDLTEAFQEACDLLLELGIKRTRDASGMARLMPILQRLGLHVVDAEGKPISSDAQWKAQVKIFLTGLIQRTVKDQQSRPLSEELLEDLLTTFTGESGVANTRLSKALNKVIVAKFGEKEQFDAALQRLFVRLFGVYWFPFIGPARDFDYQMDLPGDILKTNGELVGGRRVRWRFEAPDAFPFGYPMQATCVVANDAAIRTHLPRLKLETREQKIKYLNLVRDQKELISALNKFASDGDSTLYDQWLTERLKSASDSERAQAVRDLLQPK
ncbi:MAG: hypothetical protein JWM11_7315 [Planctomycetaceae bacterium]|nr:hypothetical protein [Planctomycetaceae bacterium]